jgi:hypothetical protein
MDQQQFDRLIRAQLQELSPDFRPELWDRMEQELNAEDAQSELTPGEEVFDAAIKNKIENIQFSNTTNHWPLLLRRLEVAQKINFQVVSLKISEAVLLLLILVTALQFEHKFHPYQNTLPAWWMPSEEPKAALPVPPHQRNSARPAYTHPKVTDLVASATALAKQYNTSTSNSTTATYPAESEEHRASSILEKRDRLTELSKLNATPILIDLPITAIAHPAPAGFFDDIADQKVEHKSFDPSPIIHMRTPKFSARSTKEDLASMIRPVRKRLSLNVGMFGGPDYNRIISPPNPELHNQRDDYYALGYGGGINVALEYGNWELGSGLVYSSKQYDPRQVGFITGSLQQGYNGEVLRQIQLNIFSIPLNARYNFIRNDRWRSYFTLSSSLQVATDATFFITSLQLPNTVTSPLPEPGRSQINNTQKGFLQGGSLRENGFVTANLGFGIERSVSDRFSIFVQPTYQHSIGYFSGGFGPDRNRINTMSVWAGIRVRVKR